MCRFKSGIFRRDGRLLTSPWTESHEELVTIFSLSDQQNPEYAHFVRLEYVPTDKTFTRFTLRVDEPRTPGWFDDEQRAVAESAFASYIAKISVREPRKLLIGGQYLLYDGAEVDNVTNCIVTAVNGSATIHDVYGSATIHNVYYLATIHNVYGSAKIITDHR